MQRADPRTPAGRVETFRGRHLRKELHRLRQTAGMSTEDVATRLDWSKGKISRLETGVSGISPSDVRLLLSVYGVTDEPEIEAMVDLARRARRRGWWHPYADLFPHAYVGLEAEATTLYGYESQLVPGLLQTEDYVRALVRSHRPDMLADEVQRRVEARLARQELLVKADAPALWLVLDEAVVRRPVGGSKVMSQQLMKIVEMASLPNLTVQVLPFAGGSHAAMGVAFTILAFVGPSHPAVVYLEHLTGQLYIDSDAALSHYSLVFDDLRAKALSPDDSIDVIGRAEAGL